MIQLDLYCLVIFRQSCLMQGIIVINLNLYIKAKLLRPKTYGRLLLYLYLRITMQSSVIAIFDMIVKWNCEKNIWLLNYMMKKCNIVTKYLKLIVMLSCMSMFCNEINNCHFSNYNLELTSSDLCNYMYYNIHTWTLSKYSNLISTILDFKFDNC